MPLNHKCFLGDSESENTTKLEKHREKVHLSLTKMTCRVNCLDIFLIWVSYNVWHFDKPFTTAYFFYKNQINWHEIADKNNLNTK